MASVCLPATVIGGLVGIGMALEGFGAWASVVGSGLDEVLLDYLMKCGLDEVLLDYLMKCLDEVRLMKCRLMKCRLMKCYSITAPDEVPG